MIDKQKLIQWVEDEIYVYSGPYDDATPEEVTKWKAKSQILRQLESNIESGEFDAADEEEFRPRFKMDAVGNLTLVEDEE